MKRRRFLMGGLGAALVAAAGIWGTDLITQSEIVSGIRRRLSFLHFDEAGLHRFSRDYIAAMLAKRPSWYRWKYHFHSLFSKPPAAQWGISNDQRTRREHLEDSFATLYLLSSDFFVNGADESRTIEYVSYYDPMIACGNHFARPAIDPATA